MHCVVTDHKTAQACTSLSSLGRVCVVEGGALAEWKEERGSCCNCS